METQDPNLPKNSGHEGQNHVCPKCGWSFPNPHPSAKHRRAHKKVCGKMEGCKSGNDVADKTQVMDGSDGEHVSDEGKNSSDKFVENSISRKSSSGVGSRSSRSTRSEEELFADATTDFTDGSGSSEASECVIQRFYSIQNDSDETNHTVENAIADNRCAPNLLLEENKDHQDQVQTVPKFSSEIATEEAGSFAETIEDFSKTPHEQDTVANAYEESVSNEENSELKISYDDPASKASENVAGLRATNEEIQDPISVPKSIGMESTSSKNDIEHLQVVDALGNFSSIEHSVEVIDAIDESTSKLSDVMEDHGLIDESKDYLPLHAHPEVDTLTKISSEDKNFKSVDDMEGNHKHDVVQNSIIDLNLVGAPSQLSSESDDSKHRNEVGTDFMTESFENEKVASNVEEQNPIVSSRHVHLETDIGEILGKELCESSLLADYATSGVPAQCEDLGNIHDNKDTGNDGEIEQAYLDGNERIEVEDSVAGSHDSIQKPDPERTHHDGESGVTHDFESIESSGRVDSSGKDDQSVLKSDDYDRSISNLIPGESLEVRDDAQCSLPSSAVNETDTFGVVESDKNNRIEQHLSISSLDVPDSSSQADSLEGNWGSVSVMSTLSDTLPATEALASIRSQASLAEQNASLELKSVMESQQSDGKTSIDPNSGCSKMEGVSEIQTLEEQQKGTISTSHEENVSLGGKRNEEIVAKVTNWSTEKNHTPLKTLLGEATARSRAESPIHYNSMPLKDEVPVTNNGFSKDVATDAPNEVGKEWDSPARYPVNIKTEKKRGKNRASWMPFFCCSSVNAR